MMMKSPIVLCFAFSTTLYGQLLDVDGNDLDDIWELYFNTSGLNAQLDSDDDGFTNAQEAAAGTDPLDARSFFQLQAKPDEESLLLEWSGLRGKSYQLYRSSSLDGFTSMGQPLDGQGNMMSESMATTGATRAFYRISVEDLDRDADQLSDWAEALLGLDPTDATTAPGVSDLSHVSLALDTPRRVTLRGLNQVAIEGMRPIRLQLIRSGRPTPLRVALSVSYGSASSADLVSIPSFVDFDFGERSKTLTFTATDDGISEPEETFTVSLVPSPDYSMMSGSIDLSIIDGTRPSLDSAELASRFLQQTTFGARETEITALATRIDSVGEQAALEEWLDAQIALPTMTFSYILAEGENPDSMHDHWLELVLDGQDQLRQRVAFALSQILVISVRHPDLNQGRGVVADYYDVLLDHSLGNFHELLKEVAVHPAMAIYLSHLGNRKADPEAGRYPDENFAREVMQLFSIGLHELYPDGTPKLDLNGEPIPTYSNADITELARVFTGLSYDQTIFQFSGLPAVRERLRQPLRMWEEHHDTGTKQLITYPGAANGGRLPAFSEDPGRTGMDDIDDAIELLFNHPNVGPFIAHRLIQRLVKSHPSPEYTAAVAAAFADNGDGVRGDLSAVTKAIFLHPEARDLVFLNQVTHGRLREPLLLEVNLMRTFSIVRNPIDNKYRYSGYIWFNNEGYVGYPNIYRMRVLESPTVFNFFTPEFSPAGPLRDRSLLAPEFEIIDDSSLVLGHYSLQLIPTLGVRRTEAPWGFQSLDFSRQISILSDSGAEALVDHLSLLFTPGQLTPTNRATILTALNDTTSQSDSDRARMAIGLILFSPEFKVAR